MSRDKDRLQKNPEELPGDNSSRPKRTHPSRDRNNELYETDPRYRKRPPRSREDLYETDPRYRQRQRPNENPQEEFYETDSGYRQRRYPSASSREDLYETDPRYRQRARSEEDRYVAESATRQRPRSPSRQRPMAVTRPLPQPKQRSPWPLLLIGCAGGILLVGVIATIVVLTTLHTLPVGNIGGLLHSTTYTKAQQYPLSVSKLTQMQVHNQVGNVSIVVDPSASSPVLTTLKKVKAGSQSDANTEFNRIAVQVQSPQSSADSTLSVNATVPDQSGSILGNTNDSVDLTLTLPPSVAYSSPTTPLILNVATSVGDVTIDHLSGILTVKDDSGNVAVHHAVLADGSHIQTGKGNVTFDGDLNIANSSNPSPKFKIESEIGNVDVTLPASTNVTLDANINVGKITSEFTISVQNTNGAESYFGPLIPNTPSPTATLNIDVSTGNINLHKSA